MDAAPIALVPELANEQHYEVPAAFFALALGTHRKYSSCYWPAGITSLDESEAAALAVTCERAGLLDGMHVLELGCGGARSRCGWPRDTPRAASPPFPIHIPSVPSSWPAARRGLGNVEVLTEDMNRFATTRTFDRVVSVEMFEHIRNWRRLLSQVHDWLNPGGRFFMHVFVHRAVPYLFEAATRATG